MVIRSFVIVCLIMLAFLPAAMAQETPPDIRELIDIEPQESKKPDADTPIPLDIRLDSLKEAALSYGARGGLAYRTWYIRQELDGRANSMDKVFDFRQLLIPASSGLLIEPPVISEAMDAMIIDQRGMSAAVADRVLNISQNVRIVSAPRTWRSYLERQWGEIEPPPDILRPANEQEREKWVGWIYEGWDIGIEQADEIFQADLNQLTADYEGMVRYRVLLAQGMVTPPYALQEDRGVTGGGNEMRIGDRALSIKELPQLQNKSEKWQSVNR